MNKPLADRILLKPHDDGGERVSVGGIVLPDTIKDRPREGTVVEVGNGMNDITGNLVPMEIQIGDVVAFHKNSGVEITIDEKNYLIMRESDVLIILNRKTPIEKIWAKKDAIRDFQNAIVEAVSGTEGNTEEIQKQNKKAVDKIFPVDKKKSINKCMNETKDLQMEATIDNKSVLKKIFPELSEKEIDSAAKTISLNYNLKKEIENG